MSRQYLVNAVKLVIEPLDVDGAALDVHARRSTLTPSYKEEITVRAQVKFKHRASRDADGLSGADVRTMVEIVITRQDAERAKYEPVMGDRITCIIDRRRRRDPVNFYVRRAHPQFQTPGGTNDWLVFAEDRQPAKAAFNS